jgi:hypothetical protein
MFVVDSIFVEPVVDGCSKINMVSEVAWPGGGGEELGFFGHQVSAIHLDVGSSVVLRDQAK